LTRARRFAKSGEHAAEPGGRPQTMSEKHLTESGWKTLAGKHKVKDSGLADALKKYCDAGEEDYDAKLKALDAVEKQARDLASDNKSNEDVAGYLKVVATEAGKARKTVEQAKKEAESKEAEAEGEEGGFAGAEEVKKTMLGLLGNVRTRDPKNPLAFMACLAGGKTGVLLAKTVGSAHKKTLLEICGGASGAKYLTGTCIWEENAHTFILDSPPKGLAKKLAKGLTEETAQKYKVRVRAPDGTGLADSDTEPDEPEAGQPQQQAPGGQTLDAGKLTEAMGKLSDAIKAAIASHPELKDDLIAKLKDFKQHITGQHLAEARGVLFEVAALVKGVGQRDFEKIHLEWDARKKQVQARLAALHDAILGEADEPESGTAAKNLDFILGRFNEGLGDTLDALQKAADSASRNTLRTKADGIADRYLEFLQTSPLIGHVEPNPFEMTIGVRETLLPPLQQLKTELQKIA
jgi:hypothetical protein